MFGAILGDIIGSPYEFDMGKKSKEFPFFDTGCGFTDDTVMTIAVAEALMQVGTEADDATIKDAIINAMHRWGAKYPDAGYGSNFGMWLYLKDRNPYYSFGNGSAMRVSAVGWLADTLEDVRRLARLSAEVTHNHPEGIKGAEAVASAIFLARKNATKSEIKEYIIKEFHYDLSRTCGEIRPGYHHVESCQQTVPEAITAFLEGEDFEDVIRTIVSLGGDCDTLTAIAGSMAEAFYGIPSVLKLEAYRYLREDLRQVLGAFENLCHMREDVAYKYHPLYWFTKDEGGVVQLQTPYADPIAYPKTNEDFETSQQALDGWRRANLYMNAFDVWDATAFGAAMEATISYGPFVDAETGIKYHLTFTTPQEADRSVYPYLTTEQESHAREGVERFYANPIAQLKWQEVILRPVVIAVTEDGQYYPLYLSEFDPDFIDFQSCDLFSF